MREIQSRFTVSELAIIAWRGKEMTANMRKDRPPVNFNSTQLGPGYPDQPINPNRIIETEDAYIFPDGINNGVPVPKKFFDEEGEFNLSKATGPEAVRYLNALGLRIGMRV